MTHNKILPFKKSMKSYCKYAYFAYCEKNYSYVNETATLLAKRVQANAAK